MGWTGCGLELELCRGNATSGDGEGLLACRDEDSTIGERDSS